MMVEKWLSADYQKSHDEASARRLMMDGPAHHQGSSNLNKYKQRWVSGYSFMCSTTKFSYT
jgi:hypothetical protein